MPTRITWPSSNRPFNQTIRARLYRHGRHRVAPYAAALCTALSALSLDVSIYAFGYCALGALFFLSWKGEFHGPYQAAFRSFQVWRDRWDACEEASVAFSRVSPPQIEQGFSELPPPPPLILPSAQEKGTQKRIIDFPPQHPPATALAHLAWQWSRLDDAVILHEHSLFPALTLLVQLSPTAHYWLRALVLPGSNSMEIMDGVQFWIPHGSRVWGTTRDFRGEVHNFKPPRSAFWVAFWDSYFAAYVSPPNPRPNVLTDSTLSERGLLRTDAGDSLDLAALYAVRPWSLTLEQIATETGEPLFNLVSARAHALRTLINATITRSTRRAQPLE